VSATTPFTRDDLADLRKDAAAVVRRHVPEYENEYRRRGWRMFPSLDRVYVNERARRDLGWAPRCDFAYVIGRLGAGEDPRSPLSRAVGSKGYPDREFVSRAYPGNRQIGARNLVALPSEKPPRTQSCELPQKP
jgi:UDP-glucose 4-epimerase